jgi:predicted TIM-barrel fold metal-dependent hydrolase
MSDRKQLDDGSNGMNEYQKGVMEGLMGAIRGVVDELWERYPSEDFLPCINLNVYMKNGQLVQELDRRFREYGYKIVKVEDV